jgi:hypothetical protein
MYETWKFRATLSPKFPVAKFDQVDGETAALPPLYASLGLSIDQKHGRDGMYET